MNNNPGSAPLHVPTSQMLLTEQHLVSFSSMAGETSPSILSRLDIRPPAGMSGRSRPCDDRKGRVVSSARWSANRLAKSVPRMGLVLTLGSRLPAGTHMDVFSASNGAYQGLFYTGAWAKARRAGTSVKPLPGQDTSWRLWAARCLRMYTDAARVQSEGFPMRKEGHCLGETLCIPSLILCRQPIAQGGVWCWRWAAGCPHMPGRVQGASMQRLAYAQ